MPKLLKDHLYHYGSSKRASKFFIPDSFDKLRSGYMLADAEMASILSQLPIAAEKLKGYDAQISQLTIVPNELKLERKNLLLFVIHGRALTSPIRRIPAEILTIIFEWCLELNLADYSYDEADFSFVDDFTEPETLQISILVAVCSVWRNLAIATRKFWLKLAVNTGSCTEATARFVDLHAERSKGLPLSLRVHNSRPSKAADLHSWHCTGWRCHLNGEGGQCNIPPPDPCHQICDDLLQNILTYASRFSTLVIYVYKSASPFQGVPNGWSASFPELRKLQICIDLGIALEDDAEFPEYNMPKLDTLILDYVPIESHDFQIKLSFHQITSLEITNAFLENILRVTQYCPQLKHLDVSFRAMYMGQQTLATLQIRLYGEYNDPEACGQLFDSLTAPSLHSVSLTSTVWPCPGFISFISRSECVIQRLTLNEVDLAEWLLPDVISLLTRLRQLDWSDMLFGDMKDQNTYTDFLQLITNHLPRLTHINLDLSLRSY
ncbi:hypothetical protein C8J56DRAFT_1062462 [Mycena floridula]|nr:hypothetical protein C8J56DRAFT_1062462 [Mycena floridula]